MAACCAMAITFAACNNTKTAGEALATDSVKYENKTKTVEVTIKVDYPTAGNAALVNAIEEFISEDLGGTYTGSLANADSMLAYYGNMQADSLNAMRDGEQLDMVYAYAYEAKKAYETDTYVTYVATTYGYTGGAHGMGSETGVTIRKSDGRRFGHDMLTGTESDAFHMLVKEGLKTYFKDCGEAIDTDEQLKALLITDNDVNYLPLPATAPYITAEGVTFIYQQYEIAPYAAGMPQFTLPLETMRPYLTATAQKMTATDK